MFSVVSVSKNPEYKEISELQYTLNKRHCPFDPPVQFSHSVMAGTFQMSSQKKTIRLDMDILNKLFYDTIVDVHSNYLLQKKMEAADLIFQQLLDLSRCNMLFMGTTTFLFGRDRRDIFIHTYGDYVMFVKIAIAKVVVMAEVVAMAKVVPTEPEPEVV